VVTTTIRLLFDCLSKVIKVTVGSQCRVGDVFVRDVVFIGTATPVDRAISGTTPEAQTKLP